ncbi:hypothetical protein EDF50_2764 [Frigoribacterium sp. PhB24]|nr:hypothetical protein EDF50_2764 [Frigoribacterium sp. PhB24]
MTDSSVLSTRRMQGLTHERLVSFVRGSVTTAVPTTELRELRPSRPVPSGAACA